MHRNALMDGSCPSARRTTLSRSQLPFLNPLARHSVGLMKQVRRTACFDIQSFQACRVSISRAGIEVDL